MNARALRARGWLPGLHDPVSRLIVCALVGLWSAGLLAASCPVDSSDVTPPYWPTDRTPGTGANYELSAIQTNEVRCGVKADLATLDNNVSPRSHTTLSAAESHADAHASGHNDGPYTRTGACSVFESGTLRIYLTYHSPKYSNALGPGHNQVMRIVVTPTSLTACEPVLPVDCSVMANKVYQAVANNKPADFNPGDTGCFAGCAGFRKKWKVVKVDGTIGLVESSRNKNANGTYNYLTKYQMTGMSCTDEPPQPESLSPNVTGPGGTGTDKYIEAPTGEGCGWANGKYMCIKSLQPDKCWTNSDGSRICAEAAPSPPKPQNATGTGTATPDSTHEVCTGTNSCQSYEYYNSNTSNSSNSQTPSSGSGDPAGEGPGTGTAGTGPGDGSGGGGGSGTGTASGGQTCEAAPTCSGDPIQCAVLEQQWRTRCADLPTDEEMDDQMGPDSDENGELMPKAALDVGSLTEYSTGWGNGTCLNDYQVNMGGLLGTYVIPFSELCPLFSWISVFVMIAAYVSGARIIVGGL